MKQAHSTARDRTASKKLRFSYVQAYIWPVGFSMFKLVNPDTRDESVQGCEELSEEAHTLPGMEVYSKEKDDGRTQNGSRGPGVYWNRGRSI